MTPEQLHQIEQARRYAEQDEYVVTRTHIRNLLAIIDAAPNLACRSVQRRLVAQWRQAEYSLDANKGQ